MAKTIHFVAGLPRAGSTVLCNLLNQNPELHLDATSPLCSVISATRDVFWNFPETRAIPNEEQAARKIRNFQRGAFHGYFANVEEEVAFDKNRLWPCHIEIAEQCFGQRPKIICCVRDLRSILASFELLWRKTKDYRVISQEQTHRGEYHTIEGRSQVLLRVDQVLGGPIQWIKDAVTRGYRENLHFVEYDSLCDKPGETIRELYAFLEREPFSHDFESVKQTIQENDTPYQWGELHKIREGPLRLAETDYKKTLPATLAKTLSAEAAFWKDL